ncbi:MAG: DNA helicase [Clostridia bacterium]|nr:DNA helicase [Clostridia bacterium]
MDIGESISKAIKESKWLKISYVNKNKENTFYWIAIKDINFKRKSLFVTIFNENKSTEVLDTWISFDGIKSAQVIDMTSYDRSDDLVEKIEKNFRLCPWLHYDLFNYNVLNYYLECNMLDCDPYQEQYECIKGIDLNVLRKNKIYQLDDNQLSTIIRDIYRYDINKANNSSYALAINKLSIDMGKKKYLVAYYNLSFDPAKKSLVLQDIVRVNQSFTIEGRRHSLFNYVNMDVDEFERMLSDNFNECQDIIRENLHTGEVLDSRPDIMLLRKDTATDLNETYKAIEEKYLNNALPTPLKSFFGNISKRNNIRRKEPSLIILDKKININQMRVLYNAMKYPVTYVQGPPGTGKTQTIINVALNAFYNDRNMLICSSNNKPVDGIVEKLKFKYYDKEINFPYLRLGNVNDVKKTTLRIKELFNYTFDKEPQDAMLNKIKVSTDNQNARLIELLNKQEKRIDIINCLKSSKRLVESFGENSSKIIDTVKEKINDLKLSLKDYPEVSNEEVTSLFIPLNENSRLSQFLFFKSLQYINKLKLPRYKTLVDICSIQDDDKRVSEFNKWTQDDNNMKLLTDAFPIIFSTNISSRRLGRNKFMFDLVVMDEAGQCNVATALIPISKAENLLLVGDPNQLRPVIVLEDNVNFALMDKYNVSSNYNYKTHSILDVMIATDNISKYILLEYHYRCGKKIISFSNQRYYNNSLNTSFLNELGEIQLLDVKNINVRQKNEAFEEASAIINYIKRNKIKDAFIVTPFVNQKELINKMLEFEKITDVKCDTVHSLQGAEKDTIIFSTAISLKSSKKTFAWLKNNYELINVATTRAKSKLVIAADTQAVGLFSDKSDDLYHLLDYAKNNGNVEVPPNESVCIEIGRSNGSEAEDEFYKTVSHFCSCHKKYNAKRNVPLYKLFDDEQLDENKEFDLVLFEKGFLGEKPVIAFELTGGEHLGMVSREVSDRRKMDICKRHGILLIFIPNSFMKSYENIADIIVASKDKITAIQQSLFDEGVLM